MKGLSCCVCLVLKQGRFVTKFLQALLDIFALGGITGFNREVEIGVLDRQIGKHPLVGYFENIAAHPANHIGNVGECARQILDANQVAHNAAFPHQAPH